MIEHFKFLKAHRKVDAEDEDPGARRAAFPAGPASVSKQVYPELDEFFADSAAT